MSRPAVGPGVAAVLGAALFGAIALLATAGAAAAQEPLGLPPDAAVHAVAAYWASGAGYAAAIEADAGRGERLAAAAAAGLAAGVGKEAFDALVQRERFSWRDLAADAAGVALFLGLAALAEGDP